jgi:hypothetical protein
MSLQSSKSDVSGMMLIIIAGATAQVEKREKAAKHQQHDTFLLDKRVQNKETQLSFVGGVALVL